MTLTVPTKTVTSIKRGLKDTPAWAVQRVLNSLDLGVHLTEDGDFGQKTEDAAKLYQATVNLTADGIIGPATQARLARSCVSKADEMKKVPNGLLAALVAGESGNLLCAVNWSVAGGVDCGFTQYRIYAQNGYSQDEIKRGFDGLLTIQILRDQLLKRYASYLSYSYVKSRPDAQEYAWRLAMLEHNWPYGAHVLATGSQLSTRLAGWVPAGVRFTDGDPVTTYRDWAKFYAMGSRTHNHVGLVVKGVFGVPRDG